MNFYNIYCKQNWILLFHSLHQVFPIFLPLVLPFLPLIFFPFLHPSHFPLPCLVRLLFVGIAIYRVTFNGSVPPLEKTSFSWPVSRALPSSSNPSSLGIFSPFDFYSCVSWFFPYTCLHRYWGCSLSNLRINGPLSQSVH